MTDTEDSWLLECIIEATHIGTWKWNIQTGETVLNENWARIIGYTLEELAPVSFKTWEKFSHPLDVLAAKSLLVRHFQQEIPYYDFESRMKHKAGHWVWVHSRGKVASRKVDGEPLILFITHSDISKRKAMEATLQENLRYSRSLIESSLDPLVTISKFGKITDANTATADITGVAKENLIGSDFSDYFTEPDKARQGYHSVFQNGFLKNYPLAIKHVNGKITDVRYNASLYFNEEGSPEGVFADARDITELKNVEEALRSEKERLSVTLKSIGDGVISTDIHGHILMMNAVSEDMTGWNQSEAMGRQVMEVLNLVDAMTRNPFPNLVYNVLKTNETIHMESRTVLISRDGKEKLIGVSAAPISISKKEITGVVLVFRDVTEKQRLDAMNQRNEKLESLGILAGGIAHDFNNLMGGVYGYIDLAKEEQDRVISSAYLSIASSTINRARGLTQQLLTFAQGGAPIMKIGPLFPLIQECGEFAVGNSNISCYFEFSKDLWDCRFDPTQISQVIDNIFINAKQAMSEGGSIALVATNLNFSEKPRHALESGRYVRLSIKDTGSGMPRELLARIFDPFFSTKKPGRGLGLATCYSILKRHGGTIEVESELGKGSTFHVYLPAAPNFPPVFPNANHLPMIKYFGTILVLEDQEIMRNVLKALLEALGYASVFKGNGKDAIAFFSNELKYGRTMSAMIFELSIPGDMGGKSTVTEIRKLSTEVPVFVASGYAGDPVMEKPARYGFTASICKPFGKRELEELLSKYLTIRT